MIKNVFSKKGIIYILIIALLATFTPGVFADTVPIKLMVNGKEVAADVPPQMIEGRTMVPVRFVSEAMGATVGWDADKQAVLINSNASSAGPRGNEIQLIVNGSRVTTDVPPQIIEGRTMVPVRFVSEALGSQVHWDNANRTVAIQAPSVVPAVPAVHESNKIIVTDSHRIDVTKESIEKRYENTKQISILDMLEFVTFDEGIVRDGATFISTLETPGGNSNRYIRIGIQDGEGLLDLTALNGSAGKIGVDLNARIDVSQTTNGMYLSVKDEVSEDEGYITPRHVIDWRNYSDETASFDTIIELSTTLWDVDHAFIEILLPYQAKITIHDIFLYMEKEVPGFSDMHERIIGGAKATTDHIHVIHNAAEFVSAVDQVAAAGTPSIIYVNGTVSYEDLIEATGEKDREISIGSEVKDLSIIGVADKGVFDGTGLKLHGHNIVVENLTFQNVEEKDALQVNNATDIWIRHNSFIDGGRELPEGTRSDELMSVKNNSQHIIISWNHFKNSNRVLLVGSNDGIDALPDRRIIMHHNFIENVTQRVPLYRGGHGHIYNNYIKNVNLSATNVRSNAKLRIENNYYEDVRDPIGDFHGGIPGQYEVSGNLFVNSTGSQPTESTITINFKNYHYELDPAKDVPEIVSKGAGAGIIQQDVEFINGL